MSNQEYVEDEINLMDYFIVIWKRKWFIFLASVLPALVVGLTMFHGPRDYTVTYTYNVKDQAAMDVSNWNLNEKNYDILISRFYSEENLNRIINKLRENDLNKYAELVNAAEDSLDGLKDLLKFEPIPEYINFSKLKITDSKQLERIWDITAQLLNMTIVGKSKEDMPKIACVIRENFESVIPVYMIHEQLSIDMRTYKTRMADIESNRFSIELSLKVNTSALERLKNMKVQPYGKTEKDIILQFDVGNKSKYLPLEYQIQAVESDIIELEKQVRINEENYNYYKDLLALTKKLSVELTTHISSYYTIQQFHSFLTELTGCYKSAELNDYLASYTKRIENKMASVMPLIEKPMVYPVAKGTVKKSAIVFVIALMMSVFAAFLFEGLKKIKTQTS